MSWADCALSTACEDNQVINIDNSASLKQQQKQQQQSLLVN